MRCDGIFVSDSFSSSLTGCVCRFYFRNIVDPCCLCYTSAVLLLEAAKPCDPSLMRVDTDSRKSH